MKTRLTNEHLAVSLQTLFLAPWHPSVLNLMRTWFGVSDIWQKEGLRQSHRMLLVGHWMFHALVKMMKHVLCRALQYWGNQLLRYGVVQTDLLKEPTRFGRGLQYQCCIIHPHSSPFHPQCPTSHICTLYVALLSVFVRHGPAAATLALTLPL